MIPQDIVGISHSGIVSKAVTGDDDFCRGIFGHLLHVLRNTDLAAEWQAGRVQTLELEEYISILELCPAATFSLENQDCGPSLAWLREHRYGANT